VINRDFVITFAFQNINYRMKQHLYKFLVVMLAVVSLSSCLWDDDKTVLSDNPNFVSLKFAKNDSIPGLEKAVFTLEYDSILIDSVIVNLDSLPYNTRIDSVFPAFVFRSTYASFLIMKDSLGTGLDTIPLTGKDTVDFSRVTAVINYAADWTVKPKTYPIKINVHLVEPELYVWHKKVDHIFNHSADVQQAVYFNNQFLFYVSSGGVNYLYTSVDAVNWTSATISGLPASANFRGISWFDGKLYLAHQNGLIYSTTDGINWIGVNPAIPGHVINNLLFVLENNLWGIFKQDANSLYYFATSQDGIAWQINGVIPVNFPVTDYAALAFTSRTGKPKAVVIGGNASDNTPLSTVWSVQKNVNNEYKWVNFTLDNPGLDSLSGTSLIRYDDKLLLFGGIINKQGDIVGTGYMESMDEGLSWRNTDSTYNVIQDTEKNIVYPSRSYQSVIHNSATHYIYLIGGKNKGANGVNVFSDVWVGKLNRMSFIRK